MKKVFSPHETEQDYLEKMLCDLGGDELVPPGHGLADEAEQDAIDGAKVVQVGRVVELFVQSDEIGNLPEFSITSAKLFSTRKTIPLCFLKSCTRP